MQVGDKVISKFRANRISEYGLIVDVYPDDEYRVRVLWIGQRRKEADTLKANLRLVV